MSKFITSVDELRKKAELYNFIPKFILMANSESKDNTEIEIVTLCQAERDAATDIAWKDLTVHDLAGVEDRIEQIIKVREHPMRNFVHIRKDKITVGVDCDRIDDEATDKAIMMLLQMDSFEVGIYRIFGESI